MSRPRIRVITIDDYHQSRPRRRLADAVLAKGGIDKNDVLSMKLVDGVWFVNLCAHNERGKFYPTRKMNVARRLVKVAP